MVMPDSEFEQELEKIMSEKQLRTERRAMSKYGGPLWDSVMNMDHHALAMKHVDLVNESASLRHRLSIYREVVRAMKETPSPETLAKAGEIVALLEDVLLDAAERAED